MGPFRALCPLTAGPSAWYTTRMSENSQSTTTELALLTQEEDTFCLAVIEFGGNLGAAYRSAFGEGVTHATAKARELMCRPEVARRIQTLAKAVEEHALISLGSHLVKLAEIRDLAIGTGQLKVALGAETKRGEAAGFYTEKLAGPKTPGAGPSAPSVMINISSNSPASVQDWATKYGKGGTVVIDV